MDDHQVVRQGLRTFLDLNEDIQVVGEAGDGQEAVELAAKLTPDIILMDLVMPAWMGSPRRPGSRHSAWERK